jgi:hypothetical protein
MQCLSEAVANLQQFRRNAAFPSKIYAAESMIANRVLQRTTPQLAAAPNEPNAWRSLEQSETLQLLR